MNATNPITVVMVDDNIDEIFLARRQVRSQGILNAFVSEQRSENLLNTLTAINTTEHHNNILVLLDVNMPRMDGFETLKSIRKHEHFKRLPVVMFSASDDEADIADALKLGADGYLVKPFAIDSFISVLGGLPQVKYHIFLGSLGEQPRVRYHLVQ